MKGRPLSCATRTSEKISKNALVEDSITFNRVNPVWDRLPTPLSVICPVSLQIKMTHRDNFPKHPVAFERGSPAYTGTFGTVFGLKIKGKTDYSAGLSSLRCPMRLTSNWVNGVILAFLHRGRPPEAVPP